MSEHDVTTAQVAEMLVVSYEYLDLFSHTQSENEVKELKEDTDLVKNSGQHV